jgi:hypothetical protein
MIQIVIDPKYDGPTILDWGISSRDVEDEFVEVRWGNTKQELTQLERLSDCNFRLFVPDTAAQERAATSLGDDIQLDQTVISTAKLALNARKTYDWRNFLEGKPLSLTRSILTKMSADALRKGRSSALADLVGDFTLENGINPIDTDVLLRLRMLLPSK